MEGLFVEVKTRERKFQIFCSSFNELNFGISESSAICVKDDENPGNFRSLTPRFTIGLFWYRDVQSIGEDVASVRLPHYFCTLGIFPCFPFSFHPSAVPLDFSTLNTRAVPG